MVHSTGLRVTLNELRGPPIAALLIPPTKYTEKTPRNFQKQNASLYARTRDALGVYLSTWPWTTEVLIYNIPRVISHWTSKAKKYNVPCHHSCADPTSDKNDTYVEKTPRNVPVWQKFRQSIPQLIWFHRTAAGGSVNLHVSPVRLKQRKVSSHPPSPICPFPIFPSLIPPSTNPRSRLLGQFDY
jgi:hypothetical protein